MRKKSLALGALGIMLLTVAVIQFIPAPPVVIPATLPESERGQHRLLDFEGITNFRDLGGYKTADGHSVVWGKLYRSGTLAEASKSDLNALNQLGLSVLIDFRSELEKEEEPNVLPDPLSFQVVEIPTLDDGNLAMVSEVRERFESGNFDGFDPNHFMTHANQQFASTFTPQFREFIDTVLAAEGKPVLWHCTAGKDRTGYAAAILLRILGVPQETVMADYLQSKSHSLNAHSKKLLLVRVMGGEEAADKLKIMMGVEADWLKAAFAVIDEQWGDFDTYVAQGLQLSQVDIDHLRQTLLQ